MANKKIRRTAPRTSSRKLPLGRSNFASYAEAESTPDLREQFDKLLFTHHIRELRGEVTIPQVDDTQPDWEVECETMYGDGHYADRKRLLYETLGSVLYKNRKADPEGIYNALNAAKMKVAYGIAGAFEKGRVDPNRALLLTRDMRVRKARHWTQRVLDFCVAMGYEDFDPPILHHGRAFLDALSVDPLLLDRVPGRSAGEPVAPSPIGPVSLPKRPEGRPRSGWPKETHRELAKAGVSAKEDRITLLIAVGALSYEDPDTTSR